MLREGFNLAVRAFFRSFAQLLITFANALGIPRI